MKIKLLIILLLCIPCRMIAQPLPRILPVTFATGLSQPIDITHAGDDRLFVVEKVGRIKILDTNGVVSLQPFLDIVSRVKSSGSEQGLLGLAFHPDYATNGYFFVYYTKTGDSLIIASYKVSPSNPDSALFSSEKILLRIYHPFTNHNGGDLNFGSDGYLYIGTGDGGSGGDPGNRAQNPKLLLGKMLRIDVDSGGFYTIPPTNPYASDTSHLPEIWAKGLRNPWRFSFDRLTGDLWIGDVGQGAWEEVDFTPVSSPGGINYGWRCYEGDHPYNLSGCLGISNYTFPVYEYESNLPVGCSLTGGYVYRGNRINFLPGHYVFADYCSGNMWTLYPDGIGGWDTTQQGTHQTFNFSTFGEDFDGDLYLGGISNGRIYKLVDNFCAFFNPELSQNDTSLCEGECITIAATGGSTYSWSGTTFVDPANPIQVICPDANLNLSVIINSYNLCIDTLEIQIGFWDTLTPLITAVGNTLTANPAGVDYQWYFNGSLIIGADLQSHQGLVSGNYSVVIVDPNGCSGQSPPYAHIATGVKGPVPGEFFVTYPNPATEHMEIRFLTTEVTDIHLEIFDQVGKRIYSEVLPEFYGYYHKSFLTSDWSSGQYLLRLSGKDLMITRPGLILHDD